MKLLHRVMTYVIFKVGLILKLNGDERQMIRLRNPKMLEKYLERYNINEIFLRDMRPFMELFLYKKNEHICREGEDISYLLFFVEGRAKVYTTLCNGKSLLLCFYEDFKVLGDLEVVDSRSVSTNVQVIEDSYCIGISIKNVRAYLLDDASFLRFVCSSLGEKLNRCSKNSSINLLYPLENRLAGYILAAGERIDSNGLTTISFDENLTQISELLGTSYRHLLRILNSLCQKGAMVKKGSHYIVADDRMLKGLAADLYK
jgi:CRP-like cAMP-binding protein